MADTTPNVLPVPDHITLGHWQDLTNYLCDLCPWASLDFPSAQEHSAKAHTPEGGNTEVIDAAADHDRFGNPVAPADPAPDAGPAPAPMPARSAPVAASGATANSSAPVAPTLPPQDS